MKSKKRAGRLRGIEEEWQKVPIMAEIGAVSRVEIDRMVASRGMSGPKGNLARAAFLVMSIVVLCLVAAAAAGGIELIIVALGAAAVALRALGVFLLALAVVAAVIPCIQVLWSQIWGPRFPMAAFGALAVAAVDTAAIAWGAANIEAVFALAGISLAELMGSVAGGWLIFLVLALFVLSFSIDVFACVKLGDVLEAINGMRYKQQLEEKAAAEGEQG